MWNEVIQLLWTVFFDPEENKYIYIILLVHRTYLAEEKCPQTVHQIHVYTDTYRLLLQRVAVCGRIVVIFLWLTTVLNWISELEGKY